MPEGSAFGVELSDHLEGEHLVRRVLFISGYSDRATGVEDAAVDPEKLPELSRTEELSSRVQSVLDG